MAKKDSQHRNGGLRLPWGVPIPTRFYKQADFSNSQISQSSKPYAPESAARAEAFAANWGYESIESDWRKLVERKDIDLIDIASPNDTHAEIAIAAAEGRQDRHVRKTAQAHIRCRSRGDGGCGGKGKGTKHGLVQLQARAGGDAAKATARRRSPGTYLSLSREVSSGLDYFGRFAAGRRRGCGGWMRP